MLTLAAAAILAFWTTHSPHGDGGSARWVHNSDEASRLRSKPGAEDEETIFHDRLTGRASPCCVITDPELLLRPPLVDKCLGPDWRVTGKIQRGEEGSVRCKQWAPTEIG